MEKLADRRIGVIFSRGTGQRERERERAGIYIGDVGRRKVFDWAGAFLETERFAVRISRSGATTSRLFRGGSCHGT